MSDRDIQIMATDAMGLADANSAKTMEIVRKARNRTGPFEYDFYAEQPVKQLLKCQYETMNCLEKIAGMLHLPKDMDIVRLHETSQRALGIAPPALRRHARPDLRAVLNEVGTEDIGHVQLPFDSDDDVSKSVAAEPRKRVAVPTVSDSDDDEFGA